MRSRYPRNLWVTFPAHRHLVAAQTLPQRVSRVLTFSCRTQVRANSHRMSQCQRALPRGRFQIPLHRLRSLPAGQRLQEEQFREYDGHLRPFLRHLRQCRLRLLSLQRRRVAIETAKVGGEPATGSKETLPSPRDQTGAFVCRNGGSLLIHATPNGRFNRRSNLRGWRQTAKALWNDPPPNTT